MNELRPNKKLINHKFDGYKLSPTTLHTDAIALTKPVHEPSLHSDIYSYVHTQCRQTHNNLYHDKWNSNVYFVDSEYQINTFLFTDDGTPSSIYQVYTVPRVKRSFDPCACTLDFPCESIALLCDGGGGVYLIHTGNRKTQEMQRWKHNENMLNDFDCVTYLSHSTIEQDTLHIVALSLQPKEAGTKSYVIYNWLQVKLNFENPGESVVKGVKRFLGSDIPTAIWFSKDYSQFMMASSQPFSLVNEQLKKIEPVHSNGVGSHTNGSAPQVYTWTQTKELLTITFTLCVTEYDVCCDIQHNNISVKLKNGSNLLEGMFEHEIIADASRWYVTGNQLEVILVKKAGNEFWTSVVPMDTHGCHVIEGEERERVEAISESLDHLTSNGDSACPQQDTHTFNMAQLEECDEDDKDLKLFSINVYTGGVEKSRNFTGHQWLFTAPSDTHNTDTHTTPLICLRHDVDGILWRPRDDGHWEHLTSFDAFGYVSASKKDRKYTSCRPDMKFVYITDCVSNVYIYEADSDNPYQHGQYIIGLRHAKRILGCQGTNRYLFVLTDQHINVIHFPE